MAVSLSLYARLALIALCAGCLGAARPAKTKQTPPKGVTIESPAQGTVARPGSVVVVKVRVDPSLNAGRVSALVGTWEELISIVDEQPPYELPLPIDRKWSGPLRIVCSVQSKRGKLVGSGELVVNVLPSDRPISIAVTDPVHMVAGSDPNRPREHINVRGTYADGMVRDVGRPDLGTTFQSSDPRVVAVDGEGYLTAGTAGRAVVTVKNGDLSELVPVHVQLKPNQPLPPIDVTNQVEFTVGPVRFDEKSSRRAQQISIKNVSSSAIHFPVDLVVTDLPSGVELLNRSGETQVVTPVGSSVATVVAAGRQSLIAPGDTVTSTLEFSSNDGDVQITHNLRLISGSRL